MAHRPRKLPQDCDSRGLGVVDAASRYRNAGWRTDCEEIDLAALRPVERLECASKMGL